MRSPPEHASAPFRYDVIRGEAAHGPTELEKDTAVRHLYEAVLAAWNRRDVNGAHEVEAHLAPIFADHPTPAYVGLVEELRSLSPDIMLLRAVSGLVPPTQDDIVPALNAIQTLVAARRGNTWQVEMFHNTSAQFHGRPDLADALTAKLREALVTSKA